MKTKLYKCFTCEKSIVNSLEGGVCKDCFEEGLKEHSSIKTGGKSMKMFLPNVDWKRGSWTIGGQVKKVLEEIGEVSEALIEQDLIHATRETLDTIQTCHTLLEMIGAQWEEEHIEKFPLERFLEEHVKKLSEKGYL